MQEFTPPAANRQANMTVPTHSRSARRAALPAALLCAALAGCATPPPPAPPLVGRWQGTMMDGPAAVPSVWEIRSDGTQSQTLTLPQGAVTAQGTWAARSGVLTERTTARSVVLGAEQKAVTLASPLETTFTYQLTGDTLTLTQPDTHQTITLTRERGTNQNRMP